MHRGTRRHLVLAACSLLSAATSRPTTMASYARASTKRHGPDLALMTMRRDVDRDWLSASAAVHRPGRAGVVAAWRYGYVNHRRFRQDRASSKTGTRGALALLVLRRGVRPRLPGDDVRMTADLIDRSTNNRLDQEM
jgi:hypothetical protein